ncbi:unnamed protein product [Lota lota]
MAMETFFEEESGPHERPRLPRPRSKGGETDTWGRRGYSATRFVRTAAHRQEHCFGHTGCEAPFMRSYSRNGALTEVPQDLHTQRDSQDHCPTWTTVRHGELCRTLTRAGPPPLEVPQDLHTQRDPPGPLPQQVSSVGLLRELVPFFWRSHKTSTRSGTPQDHCPTWSHKTSTLSGTPQDLCPSRTFAPAGELCRTLTRAGPLLLEVPQDLHTQRDPLRTFAPVGPLPQQVSSVGLLRELVPFFWRSHKTSTLSGTPQDLCPSRTFAPVGELCRTLVRAGPPLLEVPQDLHTQRDPSGPLPQ